MNYPWFESCEFSGPTAISIRHAEREPIHRYADAFDAPLTEKGKADAHRFGRSMRQINPVKLYHSPVLRCEQTAEGICTGILSLSRQAAVAGSIFDLGGPYIAGPWHEIAASIERYGHSTFVRKWFNDEFPPDFIMPLDQAAESQLQILMSQLRLGDSSAINVTHDWNIMILREYYFNLRHEDIGEPAYLDGFCAFVRDDALHLIYHEHEKVIRL